MAFAAARPRGSGFVSTTARPDLPPEKLAEIVEAIIARRPWFRLWYVLLYPFRRFPLFFFTVLPCQASRQPALLTLVLAAVTLWADWRFVPRWSWDMGPQLPEFAAKICREEVIPPILTKSDWKKIGRVALYGLPLLAAVAAVAIAAGIHLEQMGQAGGGSHHRLEVSLPRHLLRDLCLNCLKYLLFLASYHCS